MPRFIKLTSTIINTYHIKKIIIHNDKYCLHLHDQNINGSKFGWSGYILSSDSIIEICKKKNSYFYVNAIGGRSLYDKEDFKKSGIDLYFCKMDENIEFENPYLSILHLLFTYPKDHIKEQIKKYKLI